MAGNQKYAVAYVLKNGRLLTEEGSCTVSRNSNANPVNTVAKGFAGVSPGAPNCEIEVTNAVPAADFEYDPGQDIDELADVEIGVVGPGGKVATSKGYILSDTFNHGTGNEASLAFRFMGSFPRWQ